MKKTFSISEAISFGWIKFKTNWKFWILVWMLFMAGSGGMGGFNLGKVVDLNSKNDSFYFNDDDTHFRGGSVESVVLPSKEIPNIKAIRSDVLGVTSESLVSNEVRPFRNPALVFLLAIIVFAILVPIIILSALVSTIFRMGYLNLVIDASRDKDLYYKTLLNQVSLRKAIRLITAQIFISMIVFIGFLLFIIPGIYFALKYVFVTYLIVDQDLDIVSAMRKSGELTKGVKFKILGLLVLFSLLLILGFLAFIVGVVVVIIVTSISYAYVYNTLLNQLEQRDVLDKNGDSPQIDTPPEPLETVELLADENRVENQVA